MCGSKQNDKQILCRDQSHWLKLVYTMKHILWYKIIVNPSGQQEIFIFELEFVPISNMNQWSRIKQIIYQNTTRMNTNYVVKFLKYGTMA